MINLPTVLDDWIKHNLILCNHLRIWRGGFHLNSPDPIIIQYCVDILDSITIVGYITKDGVEIRPVITKGKEGGEGTHSAWIDKYGDWCDLKAADPKFFKKLRKALVSSHNWTNKCPVVLK